MSISGENTISTKDIAYLFSFSKLLLIQQSHNNGAADIRRRLGVDVTPWMEACVRASW